MDKKTLGFILILPLVMLGAKLLGHIDFSDGAIPSMCVSSNNDGSYLCIDNDTRLPNDECLIEGTYEYKSSNCIKLRELAIELGLPLRCIQSIGSASNGIWCLDKRHRIPLECMADANLADTVKCETLAVLAEEIEIHESCVRSRNGDQLWCLDDNNNLPKECLSDNNLNIDKCLALRKLADNAK